MKPNFGRLYQQWNRIKRRWLVKTQKINQNLDRRERYILQLFNKMINDEGAFFYQKNEPFGFTVFVKGRMGILEFNYAMTNGKFSAILQTGAGEKTYFKVDTPMKMTKVLWKAWEEKNKKEIERLSNAGNDIANDVMRDILEQEDGE